MLRNPRVQMIAMLVIGGLLGAAVGAAGPELFRQANTAPTPTPVVSEPLGALTQPRSPSIPVEDTAPACCSEGGSESQLLAMVDAHNAGVRETAKQAGKKPNIVFIMGDDIGWMQPSCYHRGLMVGETPNIDRMARED